MLKGKTELDTKRTVEVVSNQNDTLVLTKTKSEEQSLCGNRKEKEERFVLLTTT